MSPRVSPPVVVAATLLAVLGVLWAYVGGAMVFRLYLIPPPHYLTILILITPTLLAVVAASLGARWFLAQRRAPDSG